MNLLTLGTGQRRLFAIHDPGQHSGARARAAVICNPIGMEFVYAHRALRHLALRLARRGIDVLRFDYYGTGDSAGAESEVNAAGMRADLLDAIEAIRDAAGAARVILVGLRQGAAVAASVAATHAELVEALVLWDAVDVAPEMSGLPSRTLRLRTAGGTSGAPVDPSEEDIAAPCCWVEEITNTGALPVAVFQRIEAWLN